MEKNSNLFSIYIDELNKYKIPIQNIQDILRSNELFFFFSFFSLTRRTSSIGGILTMFRRVALHKEEKTTEMILCEFEECGHNLLHIAKLLLNIFFSLHQSMEQAAAAV